MKLEITFFNLQRKGKAKKNFKNKPTLPKKPSVCAELNLSNNENVKNLKEIESTTLRTKEIYSAAKTETAKFSTEFKSQGAQCFGSLKEAVNKTNSKDDRVCILENFSGHEMCKNACKTSEGHACDCTICEWYAGLRQAKFYYPEFFPSSVLKTQNSLELKPVVGLKFMGKSQDNFNREFFINTWLSFFG